MADKIRVKVEFLDGTVAECISATYTCTADRVAFERKFGVSSLVTSQIARLFDDSGKPLPGVDISGAREEYVAFFAWRVLNRDVADQGDFESWLERLEGLEITEESKDVEDAPDPTEADPPPVSSA